MYYKLAEPFAFRGFKRLPYAVRAESGEHDICAENLSDDVRLTFADMIKAGVLVKSDSPLASPKSYQRYKVYPCRCVDKVHRAITGKCNFRCRQLRHSQG